MIRERVWIIEWLHVSENCWIPLTGEMFCNYRHACDRRQRLMASVTANKQKFRIREYERKQQ